MKSKNMRKEWKRKKEIHQGLPFSGCYRDIPLPEEFGEVVAAFVAGDKVREKIKNVAIKVREDRKLDDLMVGEDGGWYICRRSTDPLSASYDPVFS